jgi:hypothetical protein
VGIDGSEQEPCARRPAVNLIVRFVEEQEANSSQLKRLEICRHRETTFCQRKWGEVSLSIALEANAGSLMRRQKKTRGFGRGFLTG